MCTKFSFEETVEYFNQCGFIVLDEHIEDIHIGNKLNIQDSDGYKYFISRHKIHGGLLSAKKENVIYSPQRYAIQNPYTIDNIILWMKKNNSNFTFDHGEYKGNSKYTLFFRCNVCLNVWDAQWSSIKGRRGCPYCANKRVCYDNSLAKARPDLIKEWNFAKNGNHVPDNVAARSQRKYWWICFECNHEWEATPSNRNALTEGKCSNCPKCSKSHGEKEVEKILKLYELNYIPQCKFDGCKYKKSLFFDFYLPDYNCCIEYNGQQHYRPGNFWFKDDKKSNEELEKQKIKDEIKRIFCIKENILFIIIPYWDFNKIEEVLVGQLILTKFHSF